jgi:hypothetical protein
MLVHCPMLGDRVPVKELHQKSAISRFHQFPIDSGSVPVNALEPAVTSLPVHCCTLWPVSNPNSTGRVLLRLSLSSPSVETTELVQCQTIGIR